MKTRQSIAVIMEVAASFRFSMILGFLVCPRFLAVYYADNSELEPATSRRPTLFVDKFRPIPDSIAHGATEEKALSDLQEILFLLTQRTAR
jgi:hypothetical protein